MSFLTNARVQAGRRAQDPFSPSLIDEMLCHSNGRSLVELNALVGQSCSITIEDSSHRRSMRNVTIVAFLGAKSRRFISIESVRSVIRPSFLVIDECNEEWVVSDDQLINFETPDRIARRCTVCYVCNGYHDVWCPSLIASRRQSHRAMMELTDGYLAGREDFINRITTQEDISDSRPYFNLGYTIGQIHSLDQGLIAA